MSGITLTTINARFVHAALGLRCLRANMGELRTETRIREFVLGDRPADIAERLLADAPKIIGFGVYIWNTEETARTIAILKRVAPEIVIVIGGPEVSHETEGQRPCALADYVITGWGDVTFPRLCADIVSGQKPEQKIHAGVQPPLKDLVMPYGEYTEEDIARRFIYVEASRGCPFKCEFCLSALDKTAWPFEEGRFLRELKGLYDRGARHFRFVDRTFNLKIAASLAILEFFLERLSDDLFIHFELIPDHLPEKLKSAIARFPAGRLHFEVGIQTWDTAVQARISRKQDNAAAEANLRWLREESPALIHVDLIAGLPGEDLETFGRGFDRLHALRPHEIQVGILKRLRGAPIDRHTEPHAMRYSPDAPYVVLATDKLDFGDVQRIVRFARYWDLVGNSGRFHRTLPLLLADQPFARFMRFTDWLYVHTGKTHEFALEKLCGYLHQFLTGNGAAADAVAAAVAGDYEASGAKGRLPFMASGTRPERKAGLRGKLRQARHVHA
ncbi:MAG: DUF4080 domain-containing protein [Betaproteobacteria bacterium]|jgi:hypothetical protein|nr:DUF4080 domain-containing protein [Betaproteobacteria bacterium]MDH4293927.1 DUF4080 domain-containing protein [Betaproteobacteria bacterium]MDH5342415.1 DUF4080 domain-containing protein [Betaproteobacteria bacterium]